jgi:exonuclease III
MRGVFWNSDGFRDPMKHRFVSDLSKEHTLSFVAISETVRKSFSDSFLRNLSGGRNFIWHTKEPTGRSGGILLGVDLDVFDIGAIDEGEFYVKFKVCNKSDSFKWALTVVYGPAQFERKEAFLTELVQMANHETLPILIGGDFNILRHPHEKNKDNFDQRWPFLFNAVIDGLNLKELNMTGRQFTWANNLPHPTFEKLDRILVTTDWEAKYPLSSVVALSRDISDHTPILLNTGEPVTGNQYPFKFEIGWLLRDGFFDMVKDIWTSVVEGDTPLERWQSRIRRVRQYLMFGLKILVVIIKSKRKIC